MLLYRSLAVKFPLHNFASLPAIFAAKHESLKNSSATRLGQDVTTETEYMFWIADCVRICLKAVYLPANTDLLKQDLHIGVSPV
jgi:hypothetical protein